MSLTEEEKFKRKIEVMLTELSSKNNIPYQEAKNIYNDYLGVIADIGIDFVSSHFIYYFDLRMKMNKEMAFKEFRAFIFNEK